MIDSSRGWEVRIPTLFMGYFISLLLGVAIYLMVRDPAVVIILGGLLALAQLVFFLHLGLESRPRWKLLMFLFMLLVLTVVVVGSLWIMKNLDYNLMTMDYQ